MDRPEKASRTLTYYILKLKKDKNQESKELLMPSLSSSVVKRQQSTLSKAFSKSMNTESTWQAYSKVSRIYDVKTRLGDCKFLRSKTMSILYYFMVKTPFHTRAYKWFKQLDDVRKNKYRPIVENKRGIARFKNRCDWTDFSYS